MPYLQVCIVLEEGAAHPSCIRGFLSHALDVSAGGNIPQVRHPMELRHACFGKPQERLRNNEKIRCEGLGTELLASNQAL